VRLPLLVIAFLAIAVPAAAAAPAPSLDSPVNGSATNDSTPAYSGGAGDAPDDSPTVTVKVYAGTSATGEPVQELPVTRMGASWSVVGSPALPDGLYTALAEQSDSVGGFGQSAAATFTIDTTRPETDLTSGPSGPTNDPTPEFAFASSDAAGFICRVYAAGQSSGSAFSGCASPQIAGPLTDGQYVFEAAAVDAAGNQDDSPASRSFLVDTIAPSTTILAGPGDTTVQSATFVFEASEPASFMCRLDGGVWEACRSPDSYSDLALGPHRFEVRASDAAGNAEPGPATRNWQVLQAGGTIPGVDRQALALAAAIVRIRKTVTHVSLRRLARRRALTLKGLRTPAAGTVDFRVTTRVRPRRGHVRRVTLLRARREVSAPGLYSVKARLTRPGRRLARRRAQLLVDLRLAFTDRAGRALWTRVAATMTR
jgi:Bacterial Ig-like domain